MNCFRQWDISFVILLSCSRTDRGVFRYVECWCGMQVVNRVRDNKVIYIYRTVLARSSCVS